MPAITTADGVSIFYKDWGSGQPIVFSHGWPLTADDWDAQMTFFPSPQLPGDRPRPARPWPVRPAQHRQRHGPLGCRPRRP